MKTPHILAASIVAHLRSSRVIVPGLAALILGQGAAWADFSGAFASGNFTVNITNSDGTVNTSGAPASIIMTSGDNGSGSVGNVDYTIAAPTNGRVVFDWSYVTADSDPQWDPFGYLQNGTFVQLPSNGSVLSQNGTATFGILAGQVLGFRAGTVDNRFNRATTTISNFMFSNAVYWKGGTSGVWGTGANWTLDSAGTVVTAVPDQYVDVVVAASGAANQGAMTLGQSFTIRSLQVNTGSAAVIAPGGSNTLTLSGAAGTGISVATGASLSSSAGVIFAGNSNTITTTGTGVASITGVIGGSNGLTKDGAGSLTLSGANNYSGGTTINGGALIVASGGGLPTGGNVTVNTGGVFDFGNGVAVSNSEGTAIGTLKLDGGTYRVSGGNGDLYLNRFEIGASGGSLDFTGTTNFWTRFVGAGAGISASANSTWTGAGISRFINQTVSLLPVSIASGATVTTSVLFDGTFGYKLTGAGTLYLSNPTGTNLASFRVENGFLRVANISALGTGSVTLASGYLAGLQYSGATASSSKALTLDSVGGSIYVSTSGTTLTLSGVISETGGTNRALNVYGVPAANAVLELTGANTYTGPTRISLGAVLSISTIADGGVASPMGMSGTHSDNLAIGDQGGTLRYTGASGSTNRNISLVSDGGTIDVSSLLTISGTITGSGLATLTKSGGGTLVLTGNNTHTWSTNVAGGFLQIGAYGVSGEGGTSGSIAGNVTISNGFLAFSRSDDLTYGGSVSGPGLMIKDGNGKLTLTGSNTAGVQINRGILALGSSGALGGSEPIFLLGGTLQFGPNNTTDVSSRLDSGSTNYRIDTNGQAVLFNSPLGGKAGLTKLGGGVLALAGSNSYLGGTVIEGGALQIGSGLTTGSISGDVVINAGFLSFFRTTAVAFSGKISGAGTVSKFGDEKLTLSGANTYSGETQLAGGTLALGSSGAIGTTGTIYFGGGTLQYTASNTTDYSARFRGDSSHYRVDTNGQNVTFASALTGTAPLTKLGAGTLTLTAANTYGGGTTVSGGTLQVGNGGTTGSIVGSASIAAGAVLTYYKDNVSMPGVVSDVSGAGRLNFKGVNTTGHYGAYALNGNNSSFSGTVGVGATGFETHVYVGSEQSLGTATVEISGGSGISLAGYFENTIKLNGNGWASVPDFGALTMVNAYLAGAVVLQSNSQVAALSESWNAIYGPISGAFQLEKTGQGELYLGGEQTYSKLLVSEGKAVLSAALGTGTSHLSVGADASVDIYVSQTLATLTIGAGSVVTLVSSVGEGGLADFGSAAAVPEPGALGLLLCAGLGYLSTRRARRIVSRT